MVFLNAAGGQPGWLRHSWRLNVQILPLATWQSVLPSGTLPPWSWTSTRHSSPGVSCTAQLTSGTATPVAATSATSNPTILEARRKVASTMNQNLRVPRAARKIPLT